jgi:hypothetical protein
MNSVIEDAAAQAGGLDAKTKSEKEPNQAPEVRRRDSAA